MLKARIIQPIPITVRPAINATIPSNPSNRAIIKILSRSGFFDIHCRCWSSHLSIFQQDLQVEGEHVTLVTQPQGQLTSQS